VHPVSPPTGWPGQAAALAGPVPAEVDESRLEQLVGVHSSKVSYYAQWRGTSRDLERALTALRALSEALCVTSVGPAALCDGVLEALGSLFDAEWAAVVLVDPQLLSTVRPRSVWRPGAGSPVPSPAELDALAARLTGSTAAAVPRLAEEGAAPVGVLGVPMRLDYREVGTLLVGMTRPGGQDRIGTSILETVANQIVVALRNAWLFEHSEEMRQRAVDGWAEAERRAAELTRRNEQLRHARGRLARARQAEVVSTERHRIARDLHDGVAQCLVGIGMHLEWCHRHLNPGTPAYGRVVASKELARSALGRIRAAVFELSQLERPGSGLSRALRDLAADFRSAGPLQVSVRVCGRQHELPVEVEHSLFQVSQEGLWNVVRHARAARAWLELRYRDTDTMLTIADDGTGDPAVVSRYLRATSRARSRHGLCNIGERAAELGGEARAERRRGGGVRVRVRIPDAVAPPEAGVAGRAVSGTATL
jgi:signal transduction histidine kinase